MIYLVVFLLSVFLAHLAQKARNRITFIFLSFMSVAVAAFLAGFRDISVGIDTSNYYYFHRYWLSAVGSESFFSYMDYFFSTSRTGVTEMLFAFLMGSTAQLTGSYNFFLLLVHFIIVGGVYIGAIRLKKHTYPELTLFLFYFLYYNHSLNIYRQYIAMAVIFAAVADLEEKKFLRYMFFVLAATLIHTSALLGIGPLFLYWALYMKSNYTNLVSVRRRLLVFVLMTSAILSFVSFVRFLMNNQVLSTKYLYYLDFGDTKTPLLALLFLAVEAFALFLFWNSFRKNNTYSDFYIFSSICFLLFYIIASDIHYGKRIAAYYSFLNIITIGMLTSCQQRVTNRLFVLGCTVSIVLVYWLYVYAYRNASNTLPYIIGI